MNRKEFNKLDIKGQVDYFNEELKKENNNFNSICKEIGISKNTILNRFKKEGLLPAKQEKKIIAFYDYLITENLEVKSSEIKNIKILLKFIIFIILNNKIL